MEVMAQEKCGQEEGCKLRAEEDKILTGLLALRMEEGTMSQGT